MAGQARTLPGPVHPLHSLRQPFLRAACGMTESPGSGTRLEAHGVPSTGTCGRSVLFPHPSVTHKGRTASAATRSPRGDPGQLLSPPLLGGGGGATTGRGHGCGLRGGMLRVRSVSGGYFIARCPAASPLYR